MSLNPAIRLVVLGVLFLGAAGFVARASVTEPVQMRESFATFPMQVGGWTGRLSAPFTDDILAVLGVDEYLTRTYITDTALVGLYIGYYQSQRQGDTIHSPLNCLPGAGWEPVSKDYLTIPLDSATAAAAGVDADSITINRYLIRKGLDRQVVFYWYQGHGRVVANEYWGKIYTVVDAIRTNRTDAALVRVVSPVFGSEADAETRAEQAGVDFVQSILPLLGRYLPE